MTDVRLTQTAPRHGFKYGDYDVLGTQTQGEVRPHPWLPSVEQDGEISCSSSRCSISLPPTDSHGARQRPARPGRTLACQRSITATAMRPHATSHPGDPLFALSVSHGAGRPLKTQSAISQRQHPEKPSNARWLA